MRSYNSAIKMSQESSIWNNFPVCEHDSEKSIPRKKPKEAVKGKIPKPHKGILCSSDETESWSYSLKVHLTFKESNSPSLSPWYLVSVSSLCF